MLSYRTFLCVAWLLSAAANTDCGVDADGQSTCTDQSNLLQAKVRVDVSDDVFDEAKLAQLAPGADRATTKFIEGVPIYNYHMAHAGGMQPSLLELSQAKRWVIFFPANFPDWQLDDFCYDPPGNSECESKGHPDEGGLDFVEFKGTQGELTEVLKKHPSDTPTFVEPDMPVQLDPDDMVDEHAGGEFVQVSEDVPWGLDRIDDATGLDGSYTFPLGSKQGEGAHVYVADTGINTEHVDFEGRAIPYIDCTKHAGCTACHGQVSCAQDSNGHGTHCAGTIGGKKYGVAKKAAIYGVKVLNPQGFTSWIINSLDWIASKGNKPAIWSASLGGPGKSQAYRTGIEAGIAAGVTVVVAAGNNNADACNFSPAFVPGAITVGATDSSDKRASFSNYGSCLDIYGPGVGIKSASHWNNNGETVKSGTSMACPHVSGVLAVMLGDNPGMSPAQAEDLLIKTAGKGKVQDAKPGSPNLMLNSMFGDSAEAPCIDKDSQCPGYSQGGGCTGEYASWMATNCPKSCSKCAPCIDKDSVCPGFSQGGGCTGEYASWMATNCPKSCSKCS